MERVVTVNLNGNPYQLEEPAYDALRAYLARAEAALADNPDRAEIVRDLEQAIADKCAGYLGAHKRVVTAAEMTRVIEEMGPVEGASDDAAGAEASAGSGAAKRLYRIKEGARISGVCAGIGAYFDLDANVIRVLFILAALFTSGFFILVYIAMMFLIPSAHTSAEWAAAHGVPFNAQEVIDRAKREYGRFTENAARDWRASMRAQRRAWRHSSGRWDSADGAAAAPAQPAGYVTRMTAGLFAFAFSLITAALLIVFLVALFSLLGTGAVLGWSPPADVPVWLAIVVLCIAYAAISTPFSAMRRVSYATVSGQTHGGGGADGLITLAIVGVSTLIAWMYIPEARQLMEQAYAIVRDFAEHLNRNWSWDW